jgi:hypothetical protein
MNAVLSPTSPTQPPVAHKMKHCSACETDHPIPDFAINGHSSTMKETASLTSRELAREAPNFEVSSTHP